MGESVVWRTYRFGVFAYCVSHPRRREPQSKRNHPTRDPNPGGSSFESVPCDNGKLRLSSPGLWSSDYQPTTSNVKVISPSLDILLDRRDDALVELLVSDTEKIVHMKADNAADGFSS